MRDGPQPLPRPIRMDLERRHVEFRRRTGSHVRKYGSMSPMLGVAITEILAR